MSEVATDPKAVASAASGGKPPIEPAYNSGRLDHHPSFHLGKAMREKNLNRAHNYLFALWGVLLISVILFTLLHLVTTEPVLSKKFFDSRPTTKRLLSGLRQDPTNSVLLDGAGRVVALSDTDLRWAVGRDRAVVLEAGLSDRSKRINDLRDRIVNQSLLEFRVKLSGGVGATSNSDAMKGLEASVRTNNFEEASEQFTRLIEGWGDATRKKVGETALFELNYGLEQLSQFKREQQDDVNVNLGPPRMHQIFWTSPIGALTEAVFWSFLGTLVNLIVNISQARSAGRFKSDERWVSWSKLIYGPVLSLVLILTIYFGIINAGTEVRFWLLPMLGFFFGYNTRKVAMRIDELSEKLLGTVAQSTESDAWKTRAVQEAAANVRTTAKPESMEQLKQQVTHVSDSAIIAAVTKQQTNP